MAYKNLKADNGFSLLELMLVLVIGSIILVFAVTQFANSKDQIQRQNFAREFKVNLERCRFDSVKRRADSYQDMARIVIKSTTSYDVVMDRNQNGVIESTETRTVDFTNRSDVKIITATASLPVTIWFDMRGFIASDNAGNRITPLFTICNGVCSVNSTITPANSNVISISPTGTVSMLFGGDIIPPLKDPTLSTVQIDTGINNWVTVMPNAPATSPTVGSSPIATPTSSPTPTPTTTPVSMPTSTPQATPTPSPTPRVCSMNEKASQTNCTCKSPMTIHNNGKCY